MKKKAYGFNEVRAARAIVAPKLPYEPPRPRRYCPKIALIGCGGVAAFHLRNYRQMGLNVVMLCDLDRSRAQQLARDLFPEAAVVTDFQKVLRRDDIEVVDLATHPAARVRLMQAALNARKHVLSQKPFVLDLAVGQRLADLADRQGVRLAVNQNGRWAPHWSFLRQLVEHRTLGKLATIDFTLAWDHSWIASTPFNTLRHLVLYDFAVHWFDIATVFLGGRRAKSVYATLATSASQPFAPPALAAVVADYGDAQTRWVFNAANRFDQCDRTMLCGNKGTATSQGANFNDQQVTFTTARGTASPKLAGSWFTNGFQGAMGELLRAIEENREPEHSARNNLATLELAFAALGSAESGKPVAPGTVRRLSGALLRSCTPRPSPSAKVSKKKP
ncbi:MAG: Gfo/Idh/MocA family oxidoreductase [Verrucomicrobiae bacterium]|nr:Gfo/Idh/MocA family oxidoreductase [Verrucomicrobiae bacterium]